MDLVKTTRAIKSLAPGAQFSIMGDTLIWQDEVIKQPSDAQIRGEMDRLEGVDAGNAYKVARAKAYPSMGDQLDMLWHAMDAEEIPKCAAFYDAIKAIKDANPKL